jgi:hypothetical protein
MKARSLRVAWGPFALCIGLVACSSSPPRDTSATQLAETPPRVGTAPSVAAFERAQQERAFRLQQEGRLADAASAWEVLVLLRPDVSEFRERLDETESRIETDSADHWRKAERARRRGDLEGAQTQYLLVLQLRPDHAGAADALRSIEKERNRRTYLGRLSRVTLGKRGAGGTETAPVIKPAASAPASTAGGSGSTDLKPAKRRTMPR